MNSVYNQAFTEVLEVLKNSEENIISKIPKSFIELLNKYKDNNYEVQIDFSNENWDDQIKKETQTILALIYRDYLVSPEEREKLLVEEKEEQIRIKNELREKYNPDNLFKNKNNIQEINKKTIEENIKEQQLVIIDDKPWYKKIFEKFKNMFKST